MYKQYFDNMYKQYFNSIDEKELKNQSNLMFREVSAGIYYVEKNRYGAPKIYVDLESVIMALNDVVNVTVVGSQGTFANFELN